MNMNKKKGFTIVELVIVIAVIAILAAVLIPTFSNVTKQAKQTAALQKAKNASTAVITVNGGDIAEGTKFLVCEDGAIKYVFEFKNGALSDTVEDIAAATIMAANPRGIYVADKLVKIEKKADGTNASVTFDTARGGATLIKALFGAEYAETEPIICEDKLGTVCKIKTGEADAKIEFYYAPDIAEDVIVVLPSANT